MVQMRGSRNFHQWGEGPGQSDKKALTTIFFSSQLILQKSNEPVHEISNNVVCATSKASDQPAHTRSLIRAFASRLSIL